MIEADYELVICPWLDEQGEDVITYARLLDGQWFCASCGATDHKFRAAGGWSRTGRISG